MAQYLLQKTIHQFIRDISDQHQAFTSTVITTSAAQLVALGEACMQISLDHQVDSLDWQDVSSRIAEMARIKEALIECADRDISAITDSEPGNDASLSPQQLELTCKLLLEAVSLMILAADILKAFEPMVLAQVFNDASIAQHLMVQHSQSALMLLESLLKSEHASEALRQAIQGDLTTLQRRVAG